MVIFHPFTAAISGATLWSNYIFYPFLMQKSSRARVNFKMFAPQTVAQARVLSM
jgi:hypothetical protein